MFTPPPFNSLARQILSQRSSQNDEMISFQSEHAHLSRSWILKGVDYCTNLRRVAVIAPGILEPIKELSALFSEVFLIGHDLDTLASLAPQLKNVHLIQHDLTSGFFYKIVQECERASRNKIHTLDLLASFLRLLKEDIEFEGEGFPLKEIDYAVSSNVLSQLPLHAFDFMMQQAAIHTAQFSKNQEKAPIPNTKEFHDVFDKWKMHMFHRYIRELHNLKAVTYLSDTTHKIKFNRQNTGWKKERGKTIEGWAEAQTETKYLFTECAYASWTWDTQTSDAEKLKSYEGFEVHMQILTPK